MLSPCLFVELVQAAVHLLPDCKFARAIQFGSTSNLLLCFRRSGGLRKSRHKNRHQTSKPDLGNVEGHEDHEWICPPGAAAHHCEVVVVDCHLEDSCERHPQ